jgi:hypothetical protein
MEQKTTRESIEETRLERERVKLQLDKKSLEETGTFHYRSDSKPELEFSRYKQDCRKRALDLAMLNGGTINLSLASNPAPDDILRTAEFYYEWLIAIP